ncbi:MAG: adenylyl-sulfate reductase subunit beta, partial [Desulfovibrionaceae bacterium]
KPFDGKPEPGDLDSELLFTETALVTPKEALGKKFDVSDGGMTRVWKGGELQG